MTDEELFSELCDMKRRLAVMIGELAERQQREDRTFARIMKEVRENDEHTARMGLPAPIPRVDAPNDGHPPTPAHICCEACDDVD